MIFAKIIVLFLFGLIFCLSTAAVTIVCGSLIAEVGGLGYKLWLSVEMGIFITAGTLPLVVLVVFFSKTYIFSVLLCIFYSVLSLTAESSFGVLPKFLCWLMPIPLTNLWCAGDMVRHGVKGSLGELEYLGNQAPADNGDGGCGQAEDQPEQEQNDNFSENHLGAGHRDGPQVFEGVVVSFHKEQHGGYDTIWFGMASRVAWGNWSTWSPQQCRPF